jgi:hypothetical protein
MINNFKAALILGCSINVTLGCAMSATPPDAKVVTSPRVAAPTYKSIPLDGGGWFSGITTHSSGRLYGFGDVFGAFRSDDSGNTWSYLHGNITTNDNFVSGMDVSTGNADLVAFRSPGKLSRSADGGKNWSSSLTDLDNLELVRGASPVMFHPANDNDLWMAGKRKDISGSLWRSSDGGATTAKWSKVGDTFFDSRIATSIYVHPDYPNQVWVGAKGSLSVSTDGGTSWKEVWNNGGVNNPQGKVPTVAGIVRRGSRGAHAGVGYFATDIGGYRVTATNWADASTYSTQKTLTRDGGWGPSNASVLADGTFLSGPIDGGTNEPSYYQRVSTDGGLTWPKQLPMSLSSTPRPVWSPEIKPDQTTDYGRDFIVQDPKTPSRWYVTGGLLPAISTDSGKTWKYVPNNSGIAGVMTYKVKFTRRNPNMALIPGGDMCVFVVTDGGVSGNASAASFRTIRKLMSCHEVMPSDDGKILVAAGTDQGANKSMIMRSIDSGATWKELDLTKSGLPESKEGITRSAMTPGNPDDFLVVLAGNGYENTPRVYRTTNGGATFTAVVGLPASMDTGSRYHQENSFLELDGVNASTRYFVVRRQGPFYRSTDNGATWSSLNHPSGPLDPNHSWVQSLGVDRATEGKLWAAIGWRGLSTSDDGGVNWREVVGFSHTSCVDAANGQVAVWGKRTVNGVEDQWNKLYWSPDNGVTWTEATGEGHRYAFTREIAVDPWVKGKVWVSGISVNVISGLPARTTSTLTPTASTTASTTATLKPSTTASTTGKYEAELAALSGGTVATDHSGYSGTGFVAGYDSAGVNTSFTVNAASAGARNVTLRYANGSGEARTLSIYVNGTRIRQISLAATAGWSTWGDKVDSLILNAGNNTIAYKYDSGDTANVNLDYISVS